MSLIHTALQKAAQQGAAGNSGEHTVQLPPMPPPRRSLLPMLLIGLAVAGAVAGLRWWQTRQALDQVPDTIAQPIAALTPEQIDAAQKRRAAAAATAAEESSMPPEAVTLVHDGEARVAEAKWDDAVQAFRAAADKSPNVATIWNNIGLAEKKRGKPVEADAAYAKALELNPDYPEALNNRGVLRMAQGDALTAALLFRQAIERNGKYADPYFNLAVLMENEGNWRSAVEAYKTFLEHTAIEDPGFRERIALRIEEITP